MIRRHIVIIVEKHHLLVRIDHLLLLLAVEGLSLLVSLVQLLELVGVGSADESALHVEDVAIGIHEELPLVTFYLDATHENVVVLHVHANVLLVGGHVRILLHALANEI